jgi:hypothetical protein
VHALHDRHDREIGSGAGDARLSERQRLVADLARDPEQSLVLHGEHGFVVADSQL